MKSTQTSLLSGVKSVLLLVGFFMLVPAKAHHVWLEQNSAGATLYFGEYGQNLRETSPGLLDRFGKFTVNKKSAKQTSVESLLITKTAQGFTTSSTASIGESITAQDNAHPIIERKEGEKPVRINYVPAARLVADTQAQAPSLLLDIVPTGLASNGTIEFQAFFKGAPLAKAKVEIISASGWSLEAKSGDDGKFAVALPWATTYVLELKHTDVGGERTVGSEIQKYDRANYVTSLTLRLDRGLVAPDAPPAVVPKRAS